MTQIRIFYNGNYYRLSSEPSSLDHLKRLVQNQLYSNDSIYIINKSKEEILFYAGYPPIDLLEYENLKKSLVLNPNSHFAEVIRIEMQKLKINTSIHEGFQCRECKMKPIIGSRYFCNQCNFSLCEKCEDSSNYHKHDLYKCKNPQVKKLEKKIFEGKMFNTVEQIKKLGFKDNVAIRNALNKAGYDIRIAVEILFGETK
ncbi:hypothetical protein SteCoe_26141 [Stentor coeruleus]|uniref:UBA domain-containing protein n=1 Tax=Stentor coeruleus TaxID=5963 RepID=A0A1R2BDH7_9CILI|nr:hypothetical protein SteCoe_26141 [Stentor coeruleus]